jgi:hypothetical protein
LARHRPYDLRHAALSLWLNAGAPPAQIAARAGHSVAVLLSTYAHCIDGQDEITNRQIEHALNTQNQPPDPTASGATNRWPSSWTASGATDRRSRPDPVRHMSASGSHHAPRAARRPLCTLRTQARPAPGSTRVSAGQRSIIDQLGAGGIWPTHGPQDTADGLRNRFF